MSQRAGSLLILLFGILLVEGNLQLPDISVINKEFLDNHEIDKFFSLWQVFKNDNITISDQPFTILAPHNKAEFQDVTNVKNKEHILNVLLDHIVLGLSLDLTNVTKDTSCKTLRGRVIYITLKEGKVFVGDAAVTEPKLVVPNGVIVVLDNFVITSQGKREASVLPVMKVKEDSKLAKANVTFVENVLQVLSYLKSGVRVFQHFLSRSNVSKLLENDAEYTVLVPTDYAFHRWHPIDWGFYPFSVPEFTESVIINHFLKGQYKQDQLKDGEIVKTIGGRDIIFRKSPLSVNGVSMVKGDTPVLKGNIIFISEVLFVNESVVSRLHQQHRDKETPPLLAFPWFGAQFLSHAFLALERDKRFSHITRFLNLADLAPHVSGTGYTFFVPLDTAFEQLGLDKMPDNYLSNGDGLQILLNHFVKGRLYDRDLKDGTQLQTLGNKTIKITKQKEKVHVNDAIVVESEVFVYNLGTMYYIDKLLFVRRESLPSTTIQSNKENSPSTNAPNTSKPEIESVPEEIIEENGSLPDILVADAEAATGETPLEVLKPTVSQNTTIK